MATFRVGCYQSLIIDYGYVIQKKKWYGWSNWCFYDDEEAAIQAAKRLKKKGHTIKWYI